MIVAGFEFTRGIRVHQNDPAALFLERFTGLGARIVKFARLTDNDRTCPNNQDTFDIGSSRHWSVSLFDFTLSNINN